MTFLDKAIDDIPEAQPVPQGEYDVTIQDAEVVPANPESKDPNAYHIRLRITIDGTGDETMPIFHYLVGISADCDEDRANTIGRMYKQFVKKFGMDTSGFTLRDLIFDSFTDISPYLGLSALVKLDVEDYKGRLSNKIK